jgi:hypothetical protein
MAKNAFETEASCIAFEQTNGAALDPRDAHGAIRLWMGDSADRLPPAKDGICKKGGVDRLGRPLQKGRGHGVFDMVLPWKSPCGTIVEMVPVSLKGSKGNGYGNRDLTMYDEVVIDHAEAGRALWVFLLREEAGTLLMRRVDASRVIREGTEGHHWFVRQDNRKVGERVYEYTRLRIEWSRVAKDAGHLFADADWTPFRASLDTDRPW